MLCESGWNRVPRSLVGARTFRRGRPCRLFRPQDFADPDAVCLQRLHDLCLVRPPQFKDQFAAARHPGELGHCVLRILAGGAGQPLGQRGVFGGPTQDHAGGDHAGRVRRFLGAVSEGAAGLESRAGLCPDRRRCVLDLPQMGLSCDFSRAGR